MVDRPIDLEKRLEELEQPLPIFMGPKVAKARAAYAEVLKQGRADVEHVVLLHVKLGQQRDAKEEWLEANPDADTAARARLELELGLADLEVQCADLDRRIRNQSKREARALDAWRAAELADYYAFIARVNPMVLDAIEALLQKPIEQWEPHLETLRPIAAMKANWFDAVRGHAAYREPPNDIPPVSVASAPGAFHRWMERNLRYAARLKAFVRVYGQNQVRP